MLANPVLHKISVEKYKWEPFPQIYVSRWCIYNLSIEHGKTGRNSQLLMLDLHSDNTASRKKYLQGTFPTFLLEYLLIIYNYGSLCKDGI